MKVLVIGSNGYIGSALTAQLRKNHTVIGASRFDCDVTWEAQVDAIVKEAQPEVVVNCAAFLGPVECERDVEKAFAVNAIGPYYVAKACDKYEAACVYISTDVVFGRVYGFAYTPVSTPTPVNAYGLSKLAGEEATRTADRFSIVRTAGVFGPSPNGSNGRFVDMMRTKLGAGQTMKVVTDQFMTPTYLPDLAFNLEKVVDNSYVSRGMVVHMTSKGRTNWYNFAHALRKELNMGGNLIPTKTEGYTDIRRAPNTALEPWYVATQGLIYRPWLECVKEMANA